MTLDLTSGAIDSTVAATMARKVQPYLYGLSSLQGTADGGLGTGGTFTTVGSGGTPYSRPKLAVSPSM